jgi:hypothetical protein
MELDDLIKIRHDALLLKPVMKASSKIIEKHQSIRMI